MASWLRVAGLDLAAVNSGLCVIEATTQDGHPPLQYNVLSQQAIKNEPGFVGRVKAAKDVFEEISKYSVDMVALEECVPVGGDSNTTGLQQSAFLEIVMYLLYEADIPMMIVPPTTMRSFIQASTGKQRKKSIMKNAYDRYEFNAKHPRQGERSNITDAFVHSYIGACVLFGRDGKLTGNLLPAEKHVVYGNSKKMIGLLDRNIYIRKDNEQRG